MLLECKRQNSIAASVPQRERQTISVTTDKARGVSQPAPGDRAAQFDAAFLAHWQPIYRALLRLVGDHAEAEDLALETFWRLYQQPPADQREPRLGGWLYRVATNLGLNALRSRKRRAQHEIQGWVETTADDPAQAVVAEEERARVRAILSEMAPRQAQLLTLRHDGLTYAELAVALDIAPASVGTLLARAEREFEKRYRRATRGA